MFYFAVLQYLYVQCDIQTKDGNHVSTSSQRLQYPNRFEDPLGKGGFDPFESKISSIPKLAPPTEMETQRNPFVVKQSVLSRSPQTQINSFAPQKHSLSKLPWVGDSQEERSQELLHNETTNKPIKYHYMDHNSDNIILVSIPTSDSASVKFQFVSEDEKKALLGMNHFTTHSEDSPIDLPLQNDLSAPLDSYQDPHVEFIPMNAPHRPSRQLTNTGYKPPTLPFLKTINEPMIHENLSNSKPTPVESLFTMSGTTQSNTQRARQHGENSPTHVFGEDDRIPFYNSSYPWSAVGRVKSKKGVCTGTLVGKRLVVTGSHCVPWTKSGGADKITFTPGHNKNGSPFGSTTVSNILVYLKISGAMTNQQSAFDQAVLVLEDPLGEDAGFVGYTTFTKEWLGKKCWYNVGYPIDIEKSNVPVVSSEGSIEYLDEYTIGGWRSYLLGTFIDMTGGHSGGPIWGYFGDETFPRIVALISSESAKKGNDKHGDNNLSGGPALTHLIDHAKENYDS